jgi:predicted branched-subunit amino acid permease
MLTIARIAAWLAFYGLAVFVPGMLLGRVLAGPRGRMSLVVGVLGVLAMAALLAFLFHSRMTKPVIAIAGALVGLASATVLRGRGRGR